MTTPRRTAVIVLVTAALVALAGCGDDDPDPAAAGGGGTPEVALTVANAQLSFSKEMAAGFTHGVSQVPGVRSVVRGPDIVDGGAQLRMFQDLLGRPGAAGSGVFTLNSEIFANPLAAAVRRGVPVVAVDNPPASNAGVRLFVGNDNVALGRLLADQVIEALPAGTTRGTIVLGTTSPGASVLDQRTEGMERELQQRLPGVTLLGPFDTKQEVEANRQAWGLLVAANPDALAFLGTGDADGWNLADWRRRTKGRWVAGAFDVDARSLTAVKAGDLLLVSPEHYLKGAVTGRLLAAHASAGAALPQGWIVTPAWGITPANVDAVIARQTSPANREAWFDPAAAAIVADPATVTRMMPGEG